MTVLFLCMFAHTTDIVGTSEETLAENAELESIYAELSAASHNNELDAFCMYLCVLLWMYEFTTIILTLDFYI